MHRLLPVLVLSLLCAGCLTVDDTVPEDNTAPPQTGVRPFLVDELDLKTPPSADPLMPDYVVPEASGGIARQLAAERLLRSYLEDGADRSALLEAHRLLEQNIDLRRMAREHRDALTAKREACDRELRRRGLDPSDPATQAWLMEYQRAKYEIQGVWEDLGRFQGAQGY